MSNTSKILRPVKRGYTIKVEIDSENAVNFAYSAPIEAIEAVAHLIAVQSSLTNHYLKAREAMIQGKFNPNAMHDFMADDNGICMACGKPENASNHTTVKL